MTRAASGWARRKLAASASARFAVLAGFVINASKAVWPCAVCAISKPSALTRMSFGDLDPEMRRISAAVCIPSRPGIFQSRNTTSGSSPDLAVSRAFKQASPEVNCRLARPSVPSSSPITFRALSLSSTAQARSPRSSCAAGSFALCSTLSRRAVNQNSDPSPTWLSTPTLPPISSARRLLMAKPRPVPPYLRVVDASPCSKL